MQRQRKSTALILALSLLLTLFTGMGSLGHIMAVPEILAEEPATQGAPKDAPGGSGVPLPPDFKKLEDFKDHDDAYVIEESFESPIGTFELLTGDFAESLPFQGDLPETEDDELYFYFRARFTNEQHIPLDISMLFAYLFIEDPEADPAVPTPLFEASLYAVEGDQLLSEGQLVRSGETLDGLFVLTLPQEEVPKDPLRLRVYFANGRTKTVCRLGSVCEGLTDEVFEVARRED